jgi:hypothetical protein
MYGTLLLTSCASGSPSCCSACFFNSGSCNSGKKQEAAAAAAAAFTRYELHNYYTAIINSLKRTIAGDVSLAQAAAILSSA